jgi:DNA-binding response OmpR family regulator
MDAASLDLKQVLAAREQAIARQDRRGDPRDDPRDDNADRFELGSGRMTASDSTKAAHQCTAGHDVVCQAAGETRCDQCDDSSCGMNVVGNAAGRKLEGSAGEQAARTLEPTVEPTGVSFFRADSGKKALELLRMLRFDLLVTGDRLPDMPVTHLIRRVRIAWPWQKWAMVGAALTTEDEIAARTLGAMAVFDAPPDWDAISSLAVTAASRVATKKSAYADGRVAGGLESPASADEPHVAGDRSGLLPGTLPSVLGSTAGNIVAGGVLRPAVKGRNSSRAAMLSEGAAKRSVG